MVTSSRPPVLRDPQTTRPAARLSAGGVHPWATSSRWIMLMLVLSAVTWRTASIYSGGLDFVAVGKAALGVLAVLFAWAARTRAGKGRPMGTTFVWLLLGFIIISTFGAWTQGHAGVAGILAVRLLLTASAIVLLVKTFPAAQLVRDLLGSMAVIALVAGITGIPSFFVEGRLYGGVLQMHSNELSLVFALPAIGGLYLLLRGQAHAIHLVVLAAMLVGLVATDSRTALLTVVLGFLTMLPQARRLPPLLTITLIACIPAIMFLMVGTDVFQGLLEREGEGDVTTLNSRSIVWEAAFNYPPTEWVRWMGTGLSTKQIPVDGQYWDQQVLDSSWVSALVQAGWLGVGLLAVWVLLVAAMTLRMERGTRMLSQALLLALVARSILESGLMDSSPAFLTLALISLIVDQPAERRTRRLRGLEPRATWPASQRPTGRLPAGSAPR